MTIPSKQKLIADALQSIRPGATIIVDIGYAQTPNMLLKKAGNKVFGIDLASVPVPAGYDAVHQCDLNVEKLPFADGSVDVVTMGCTLAHVANPLKVLAEVNRVLRPDGVLIVSSPNPNYYWENALNIFYHYFKHRVVKVKHYEHFFEFSRYNMRTSADRTGFEVVREIGCTFALVKTPFVFDVQRFPGMAYEIVYVLEKKRPPESYATFEDKNGIKRLPTTLYE